ncbi:MAG: hypothetical protein ACKOKG_13420 [Verrucomicrobiota bacterium]
MTHSTDTFESALEAYRQACLLVIDLFQAEADALASGSLDQLKGFAERRKAALVRLEGAQKATRETAPRPISETQRTRIQGVADLIQRAVRLDRQNEQGWLRRQLMPPGMVPNSATRNPARIRSIYGFPGGSKGL